MRLKTFESSDRETTILFFLLMASTMLVTYIMLIQLTSIFIMLVLFAKNGSYKKAGKAVKQINALSWSGIGALSFLILLQFAVNHFGVLEFVRAISIAVTIFFFLFIEKFLLKSLSIKLSFLKAVLWFDIFFSGIYLGLLVIKGFPEERDSVLGYVSSNYCAAILYLTYPLILYYLFNVFDKDRKKYSDMVNKSILALILSLLVILTSGSRTAFGVVMAIVFSLVLYKQESINAKLKSLLVIAIGLLAVYVLYLCNSNLQQLVGRAMQSLQGTESVKTDVRTLIWASGLRQFELSNKFFGSGTNIIKEFVRPAHNLPLETLMTIGYFGVILLGVLIIINLILLLKNCNYQKAFFIIQLFGAAAIVAYVQPFFSTALTCGVIVWCSAFSIVFDEQKSKGRIVGRKPA